MSNTTDARLAELQQAGIDFTGWKPPKEGSAIHYGGHKPDGGYATIPCPARGASMLMSLNWDNVTCKRCSKAVL